MENSMFTYSELVRIRVALKWRLEMEERLLKASEKESEKTQQYCETNVRKTKVLIAKVDNLLMQ